MDDIELLICMIETEVNKTKYQMRIAAAKGQKQKYKALVNKMTGLKVSLNFIEEIENMEE